MTRKLALALLSAVLLFPSLALSQTRRAPTAREDAGGGAPISLPQLPDPLGLRNVTGGSTGGTSLLGATNPLAKPLQDLADFISGDASGAIQLAMQIPELQDPNGAACWGAMVTATKVFQAHPVPLTLKLMTDHEAVRLLVMSANKLCANTACTVVFADATNIAQTASPTPIAIPSLQTLCSKVAQLAPPIPELVLPAVPPATQAPAAPAEAPKP